MTILALLYFASVLVCAFRKFEWSVYLCVALPPLYIIRPSIGLLPTTVLELTIIAVLVAGVVRITRHDFDLFKVSITTHAPFWIAAAAFLFFSCIGAIVSMNGANEPVQKLIQGLGEWRALFLEPIALCVLLIVYQKRLKVDLIVWALLGSAMAVSVVAVVQKLTGAWFPPSIADTYLFGRVTSVYTSANALGLFVIPIVCVSALLWKKYAVAVSVMWACILFAVFFSQSQGAFIAFGAALCVFLLVQKYYKTVAGIVIMGILAVMLIPSLRAAVLFQDRAGQNRIMVWEHTIGYLMEHPQHFVFGTGIRNFFDAIQSPWYDVTVLEALKYPHNIFLNFWTEIGLFGMLSFVFLFLYLVRTTLLIQDRLVKASLLASLTAIMIHGLVDVPYFKNDLAVLFWILVFLVLIFSVRTVDTRKIS
mgnify:CR=1 FL=1